MNSLISETEEHPGVISISMITTYLHHDVHGLFLYLVHNTEEEAVECFATKTAAQAVAKGDAEEAEAEADRA